MCPPPPLDVGPAKSAVGGLVRSGVGPVGIELVGINSEVRFCLYLNKHFLCHNNVKQKKKSITGTNLQIQSIIHGYHRSRASHRWLFG